MLNMWQSTMYSSMVPFFLRWNHERAYRTLVLRWVPSEGWPGVGLQWKQQGGTGKLNVFFKPILRKCVCSNFEIHTILYHLKSIVCLASIRGKTWPWGAGHFPTLEVSTCQMPRYVPAGGGGVVAGVYIDWCITMADSTKAFKPQADHPLLVGAIVDWNLSNDLLLFIEEIHMNNTVAIICSKMQNLKQIFQ